MHISSSRSAIQLTPYPGLVPVGGGRVDPISGIGEAEERIRAQEEEGAEALPLGASAKDSADFSAAGLEALARENAGAKSAQGTEQATSKASESESTDSSRENNSSGEVAEEKAATNEQQLTTEEQEQVRKLQARDADVRAHEAAHSAAAGSLATGGPSYDYQEGPDGVSYAVGGEVGISFGGGATPEERAANAEQAQRAATAPANPSGADRAVAARASQAAASARREIQEAQREQVAASETETNEPVQASEPTANAEPTQAAQAVQAKALPGAPKAENGRPDAEALPGNSAAGAARVEQQDAAKADRSAEEQRRAKAYTASERPTEEVPQILGELFG
jgi:hypothetical protein